MPEKKPQPRVRQWLRPVSPRLAVTSAGAELQRYASGESGPFAKAFRTWLNGASASVLWRAQLANGIEAGFPGGSRGRVNRAGNHVREGTATDEDVAIIDTWREAHRHVINSFQAILRKRTRGTGIVVAQRHKRKRTIYDKLQRFSKMQLSRMDDVAGCRLIFETIEDLKNFRGAFHSSARFNHKLKNALEKYDYITRPKSSGYRGIHDVYEYDVRSNAGRHRKGLLIELQYRTFHQHAWATCVEMVGILTEDQPKFDRGDEQIKYILRLASEIIARAFEGMPSSLPDLSNEELVQEFTALDGELHLMRMLRDLNMADSQLSNDKNVILIFKGAVLDEDEGLEVRSYPSTTSALRALFDLESENLLGWDIVLVGSDRPEDVREAFRNYFSDASQFIDLIEKGCRELMAGRVVLIPMEESEKNA